MNKRFFFTAYIQQYNWSKGLFDDKKSAKRLRDGIQRYFKELFKKEAVDRALNNEAPAKIVAVIRQEINSIIEAQEAEKLLQWISIHVNRI